MQEGLREELESWSIYQVRMYARDVGVKLPTTMKKGELIDAIVDIWDGKQLPYKKTTKKGRPPKGVFDIKSKELNKMEPARIGMSNFDYGFDGLFSFDFDGATKKANAKVDEFEGLVDIFLNGSAMIVPLDSTGFYCYISSDNVVKYKLKKGDKVKAVGFEISNGMPYVFEKMISINGREDVENISEKDFTDTEKRVFDEEFKVVETNLVSKLHNYAGTKVYKGDKVLVVGDDRRVLALSTYNLVEALQSVKGLQIVVIAVNSNPSHVNAYNKFENVTFIGASFAQKADIQLKMFSLGLLHAKNLSAYKGNHVLCIVPDVGEVINLYGDKYEDSSPEMLKKFYTKAVNMGDSSLTISYGLTKNCPLLEEFETNEDVYFKTCSIEDSRQLNYKFDWIRSGRNSLESAIVGENEYNYLIPMYIRNNGNLVKSQRQLEDWVALGLSRDDIVDKIKNLI